ncbi:MAG: hypothetical protein ACNA8W_08355, partial [Bradymonadaceae bacterium]
LFELLEDLTRELPGCRLTSVVSQETGLSLASVAGTDPLDAAGADAFHSDLYRITSHALAELDFSQSPQGFVLTGKESIFVSLPLEETGYFWHVATDRRTTVGFTQAIMRKHARRIQESVRELFE